MRDGEARRLESTFDDAGGGCCKRGAQVVVKKGREVIGGSGDLLLW